MVFSWFWDSPWKKSYASFTDQREYEICNENFQFCTKMYTRPTMNGIEFVFNNQTVLIWLFFAKMPHGIELCSFNRILHCMQIPLMVWLMGMKIYLMSHVMIISFIHGPLMAIMFVFRVCIRVHI